MGLKLKRPGELSGWLGLAAALRKQGANGEDADKAAKLLEGVEVRVRTLPRRKYLELLAGTDGIDKAEGFDRILLSEDADVAIMREGLAAIRGLDGGDPEAIDDDLLAALEATKLHGLISWLAVRWNGLAPEERAAFFT